MNRLKIFFILILSVNGLISQDSIIQDLKKIKGITVTKKENLNFKEYFEIFIDQPLDHFSLGGKKFRQRFFLGFNKSSAPTVMETDGYQVDYADRIDFINESARITDGNMLIVEHRFYGLSIPDSLNWNLLTIKQAAYDNHHIRQILSKLLKGKWLSCGISKGGQTALAYKMYFPEDVDATILYSTPVKNGINDKRLSDYMHSVSKKQAGNKIFSFCKFALSNKKALLPEFNSYVKNKGLNFGKMDNETVFDYVLLEYPFSFLQNCSDLLQIPDSTIPADKIIAEIVKVVPAKFFSDALLEKLASSFYMFYHELGYYEYDLGEVKHLLKNNSYPNNIFAPKNIKITFDPAYLNSLNTFVNNLKSEKILFIYGELDPYAATQPNCDGKDCKIVVVKNGCHKSRLYHLPKEQQEVVYHLLGSWLQCPVNKNNGRKIRAH